LLLEEELKEIGYTVILASSGEEGINIFSKTQIDIVILDINMPGINGLEILRILKHKNNNVPVVLYSAFTEFKEKIETWAADAYVKKSVDLRELFDTVGKFLSG
jgi:DNA-binding response OmpR family regulator